MATSGEKSTDSDDSDYVVVWEWLHQTKVWHHYEPGVSNFIEQNRPKEGRSLDLGPADSSLSNYVIDAASKRQINLATGWRRRIRRKLYSANSALGQGVLWQFEGNEGEWTAYDPKTADLLEEAVCSGDDVIEIRIGVKKAKYTIDFKAMTQQRENTGKVRNILRTSLQTMFMKHDDTSAWADSSDTESDHSTTKPYSKKKRPPKHRSPKVKDSKDSSKDEGKDSKDSSKSSKRDGAKKDTSRPATTSKFTDIKKAVSKLLTTSERSDDSKSKRAPKSATSSKSGDGDKRTIRPATRSKHGASGDADDSKPEVSAKTGSDLGHPKRSCTKPDCDYKELCEAFRNSLQLSKADFSGTYNKCFCSACYKGPTHQNYGQPSKKSSIPIGWYRFSLRAPSRAYSLKAFEKWHRSFHGTCQQHLKSILEVGDLAPAGRTILGGKVIAEAPGHFTPTRKPDGFDTKQIFLSPSIHYSSHDAYAKASQFTYNGKSYSAKVVFLVLVNPASYKIGPQTIGARAPIDGAISNDELEWMTNQQGSTILCGLLVKLE